jgi:hypothetical protein
MTNVVTRFISRGVAVGAFLLLVAGAAEVRAQQTLFNVPSANTAERGRTFVEMTSSFRTWGPTSANDYSVFVPRVADGRRSSSRFTEG